METSINFIPYEEGLHSFQNELFACKNKLKEGHLLRVHSAQAAV